MDVSQERLTPLPLSRRTNGAGAVVSGTEQMISGSDKSLAFVVLGQVLVVSTPTYFGLNIFMNLVQVRSFCCIWCTRVSDAANVFRLGRSFQSTVRPLVVETWPSCDEQESQGR